MKGGEGSMLTLHPTIDLLAGDNVCRSHSLESKAGASSVKITKIHTQALTKRKAHSESKIRQRNMP